LPFGQGQKFLGGAHGVVQQLVGNWNFNGITEIHTGFALGFTANTNTAGTAVGDRPNFVAGCSTSVPSPGPTGWFNKACFVQPPTGTLGTMPRTFLYGPGQVNMDMSLSKSFAITERLNAQFRSEFFNIFNHPQFGPPNAAFGNAAFSTITATVNNARQVQFALKLMF
jgi:hypothetical protein